MWGVRTLNPVFFGPIHEILLHDGKNFYHVGDRTQGGGNFGKLSFFEWTIVPFGTPSPEKYGKLPIK